MTVRIVLIFLQEMSHFRIIALLLSLQLSWLQLRPTVASLQCYRCNSIETPSCEDAGETSEWDTCRDNMCITGIGFTQTVFGNLT